MIDALQFLRETLRIAERRRCHAGTQPHPQRGERFDVVGAGDGLGDILIARVAATQSDESQRAHDGGAEAADRGTRREAHGRHAEPCRFDCGGAAVVREGIERDVDLGVGFPSLRLRRRERQVDTVAPMPIRGEEIAEAAADFIIAERDRVQHEA